MRNRAAVIDWALTRITVPTWIAHRYAMCPYCRVLRRDPTDHCPRCHL